MYKHTVLATAIVLFSGAQLRGADCHETVLVDSVEYSVGERWCGKQIDSTRLAVRERLVRVPDEYCFEDYGIYIDSAARGAFVLMAETAKADSIFLILDSGYRSARYQEKIITRRMAEGEKFADIVRYVAPPGYSEHETGYTIDLVPSDPSFAKTSAYKWLMENAGNFGFIESSPKDSTGLMPWEPWHWSYQLESR